MSDRYTNNTFYEIFEKKNPGDILWHEKKLVLTLRKILEVIKNDEVDDKNTVNEQIINIRSIIDSLKNRKDDFYYDIDFEFDSTHIILLYEIYFKLCKVNVNKETTTLSHKKKQANTRNEMTTRAPGALLHSSGSQSTNVSPFNRQAGFDKELANWTTIPGNDNTYELFIRQENQKKDDKEEYVLQKIFQLNIIFDSCTYFINYIINEKNNIIIIKISFILDDKLNGLPRKYGFTLNLNFKYDKFREHYLDYIENRNKKNSDISLSNPSIHDLLSSYKVQIGFFDPTNGQYDILKDGYGKYDCKDIQVRYKKFIHKKPNTERGVDLYKANININSFIDFYFLGQILFLDVTSQEIKMVNIYESLNGIIYWDWETLFLYPNINRKHMEQCSIKNRNFEGIFYFNKSTKFEGTYEEKILNGIITYTVYGKQYRYELKDVLYPDLFYNNNIIINSINSGEIIYLNENDNKQILRKEQLQNVSNEEQLQNVSRGEQYLQKNNLSSKKQPSSSKKQPKRNRFLPKDVRNKKKTQLNVRGSSSVVKQENTYELNYLLDTFLNKNILEDINNKQFNQSLNHFINLCSKYHLKNDKNIILNKRRKLIFPILDEMNKNKIINEIIRNITGKKDIYIVDVSNFIYKTNIQSTDNKTYINAFINKYNISEENLYIFVCQGEYNVDGLIKYEYYTYNGITNIIISVSCLSNVNNLDLNNNIEKIKQIINHIKNKKNTGIDCYKNNFQQNPLDDFVILVILQCLYEFTTNIVNFSKYFKDIFPFNIKNIKIISDDNFLDWNNFRRISPYLIKEPKEKKSSSIQSRYQNDSNSSNNYIGPVFPFNFLNNYTAYIMQQLYNLQSM